MLNLYIRADDPLLAELDKRYDALFLQVEAVEAALSVANQTKGMRVRGGKRPDTAKEQLIWRERERCYEAACLELKRRIDAMHPFIEPVNEECKRLRGDQFLSHSNWWHKSVCHRANVLTAERLYDAAAEFYFSKEHKTDANATYLLFGGEPSVVPVREWLPMFSGHGSPYRFDGPGKGEEVPPGPYMTEEEANQAAWDWVGHACTIGGGAQVHNVRTGETKHWQNPETYRSGAAK